MSRAIGSQSQPFSPSTTVWKEPWAAGNECRVCVLLKQACADLAQTVKARQLVDVSVACAWGGPPRAEL